MPEAGRTQSGEGHPVLACVWVGRCVKFSGSHLPHVNPFFTACLAKKILQGLIQAVREHDAVGGDMASTGCRRHNVMATVAVLN